MRQFSKHHFHRNAGLTLIELLVVLSVIAVLSTVALRNVVGTFEEKNYDANISQLEQIELAILGDDEAAGFLGDIGRLPIAVGDSTATNFSQLAELWDQSASSLPNYAIKTPAGDDEVRLGTGWRGPYLNLGINRNDLRDGFANRFLLFQADGTDSDNRDPIAIVQSLGPDGPGTNSTYGEDLEVVFEAGAGAVTAGLADAEANNWETDLQVTVVRDGGLILTNTPPAFLIVRVYGADGSGGIYTEEQGKHPISADIPSHTFTLNGLSLGAKVLRAYKVTTDPATKESPIVTPTRKSPATDITVGRLTGPITLTLY